MLFWFFLSQKLYFYNFHSFLFFCESRVSRQISSSHTMDWKLIFLVAWVLIKNVQGSKYPVHELDESSLIRCCNVPRHDLEIYCYSGHPKHLFHVWETVQLTISLNPDQYDHFEGYDAIDVTDKFENLKSTWNFNHFMYKRKFIKLNPVNRTCVGIASAQDYNLAINRIRVDFWKVLQSLIGLLLFITAPKLSSSSIFYYLTGISVGTCASILILIYILSRFMPKKPIMYSFLAGGWAVGLYMAQMVFDNIKTIVIEYKSYMIYYLLSTSIISFMICYKIGPVTDPKSINLIKWAMQSVGLILIFLSSDFQEASMTLVLALLLFYNLKTWISFNYFKRIKNWWKPPVPRLLTEDEYHQQGAIETEKALDELRGFCSSPDCNQWKTVLRLQKPARFAKFVEGGSHLEDDEVLAFHDEESKLSDSSSLISEDESD